MQQTGSACKQAVIDIGSNSIRLTVYRIEGDSFKILFREKIMAGLAGYVENGSLSAEGIDCACRALAEFKSTLQALELGGAAVFATASLRNIANTQQALDKIEQTSGFSVEVLSGEQEARLGYLGAMQEVKICDGAFMDIGGASTEVVTFSGGQMIHSASFAVGSLSLYKNCVKKILPGQGSQSRIEAAIQKEIDEKSIFSKIPCKSLVCVGGTARAILKLAIYYHALPETTRCLCRSEVESLCRFLQSGDKSAVQLILRLEPGRIHTLLPGLMILQHMMNYFSAEELVISKYGVREGYLCQKILKNSASNTAAPKIGN